MTTDSGVAVCALAGSGKLERLDGALSKVDDKHQVVCGCLSFYKAQTNSKVELSKVISTRKKHDYC